MTNPITILITCFNEEKNIARAIKSALWADEILLVDSFSTDRTLEIARELGVTRILQHEYKSAAAQRKWALPQCTHEWVMLLDSDEEISPELAREIQDFLKDPGKYHAMRMYRGNFFLGKRIRYSGWQDDDVLRVFPKKEIHWEDRRVHANGTVNGPIKTAKGKLYHYTFSNFSQYMEKFDRYTTWASFDREKRTKDVGVIHLLGRPVWRFFKQYILRFGFLDGKAGLIVCMLAAFSVFLKYAKLWERQNNKNSAQ